MLAAREGRPMVGHIHVEAELHRETRYRLRIGSRTQDPEFGQRANGLDEEIQRTARRFDRHVPVAAAPEHGISVRTDLRGDGFACEIARKRLAVQKPAARSERHLPGRTKDRDERQLPALSQAATDQGEVTSGGPLRYALDQHLNCAIAAESQPEDQILVAASVVGNGDRAARREHRLRALHKIGLEATAGNQADARPVRRQEHARASPAVGRTGHAHDCCKGRDFAAAADVLEFPNQIPQVAHGPSRVSRDSGD